MKYFNSTEILFSIIAFLAVGIFFGGLYHSFKLLFVFIKDVLFSYKRAHIRYNKKAKTVKILEQNSHNNSFLMQITDFIFVIFSGVTYILFLYIFLDGTFRFFSLMFFAVGYIFSLKTLDKFFSFALRKTLKAILLVFDFLTFVLLAPIFYLFGIIKRILIPIINFIALRYKNKRIKSLIKNKKRQARNFFKALALFLIIST